MNQSARLAAHVLAAATPAAHAELGTDEDLARRGDADSFAVLYERHLPAVYRYLSGRLASRDEAEDLTSEAFRRAWSSRTAYRGQGTVRAWIFTIAHRTLADHYRRTRTTSGLEPLETENIVDKQVSPEDSVIRDEHTAHVRRLLQELSPQQQEILRLRFAAELTYAEIATVLGKREDAVKKIVYRALEALRGSMTDA